MPEPSKGLGKSSDRIPNRDIVVSGHDDLWARKRQQEFSSFFKLMFTSTLSEVSRNDYEIGACFMDGSDQWFDRPAVDFTKVDIGEMDDSSHRSQVLINIRAGIMGKYEYEV